MTSHPRPAVVASSAPGYPVTELTKALYSPKEVADMLELSTDTILDYIHEGKLFAIQLSPSTFKIPQRAVARLLGIPVPASTIEHIPYGGDQAAADFFDALIESEHEPFTR